VVGSSLGATFLLKYLSENKFPKKILQLHLVAPAVFDDKLTIERLSTFKFNVNNIKKVENICKEIHVWHSKDDPIVSFRNSEIVKEKIPNAYLHVFKDRKHFSQPAFPEILEVINKAK
jgi:predicted alpha/beta hydrolase family esterase